MAAEDDIDQIVLTQFFQGRTGVLVEVGAAMPDYLSIGAGFRRAGWKVVAIEPIPDFCAAQRAAGNDVLQYAVSDEDSDNVDFTVVDSEGVDYHGGKVSFESYSSLGIKDEYAKLYATGTERPKRSIKVNVRKLDTILAQHEPQLDHFDVLAADVEGWELNVMRGLTIEKYKPSVVILENLFKSKEYRRYMRSVGYRLWRKMKPNEIYVRTTSSPVMAWLRGLLGNY